MGLPNASTSKSHLIIALPPSPQPSFQIPFDVSWEQETFNKTSLIEFVGRELCGLAHAVAAVCPSSQRPASSKGFYSVKPNCCSEGFYVSRPDKNRPYCAAHFLARGPEVAKNEVARGTTDGWKV